MEVKDSNCNPLMDGDTVTKLRGSSQLLKCRTSIKKIRVTVDSSEADSWINASASFKWLSC